jgi:aminopeptidase YwaD
MYRRKVMKYITLILPGMLFLVLLSCRSNREVTIIELQDHIKYLASDELEGRQTGSEGDSLAAVYIKEELSSCGFEPLTGDGMQIYTVTAGIHPGKANAITVNGRTYNPESDFMPFSFSSNSTLESEVFFAGYGFNIQGDSLKWNDYQGIDVKGKWVLILRGDPESEKTVTPFLPYSGDRDKALMAKDMGAAGVLMVSGPVYDPDDAAETLNAGDYSVDIPVIRIKRNVADDILAARNKKIADLEKVLNSSRKPVNFETNTLVSATTEIIREEKRTRNVAMILKGEDKNISTEYLIMGAHFDHLGMGGKGSSSRAVDTTGVHHGADDNASGISMMLELAEKFAGTKGTHKRSIICLAFSGEEMGLLGSKYFTENSGVDLSKVNAMINLDMVGRLQESNVLQISGVGTSPAFKEMLTGLNDTNLLKLTLSDEGYGPSDHSSFYGKNIPVLFFSTGAHLDYHTPSDTWDKINYEGMKTISMLLFKVAEMAANSEEKLMFSEAGPRTDQARTARRRGVTLGIMPDFAGNVKNGLRADFVTPGKPAALGGMKKGDIITSINGMKVNNIQDYMFRMGQLKHGQTISVEVLRDTKTEVLLIQL